MSTEHVQEAMLYVKGADNIAPRARLEDFNIIQNITHKCGYKARIIKQPSLKSTTETPVSTARNDLVSPCVFR